MSIVICKDFIKGNCKRGRKCKFAHTPPRTTSTMSSTPETRVSLEPSAPPMPVRSVNVPVEPSAPPMPRARAQNGRSAPPAVGVAPRTAPRTKVAPKNKTYTLQELGYVLAELAVEVSNNEPANILKDIKDIASTLSFSLRYTDHLPKSDCHHPVDGKVLRAIASQRAIASAIHLISRQNPNCKVLNIVDLWGNNRTESMLKRACSLGDYQSNRKLFTYKCVAGNYDAKDMLRSNSRSCFETMSVSERLTNCDILFIQDVQQNTTTKAAILDLALRTQVLVMVFHLEIGPFGYNGYHGFYVKDGQNYVNYASIDDAPYVDRESCEWLFGASFAIHKETRICWCVQNIYGNVYFATIAKDFSFDSLGGSVKVEEVFKAGTLEVTNETVYLFPKWFCCVDTEAIDEWLGSGKVELNGFYHSHIVDESINMLEGQTYGPGLDKRLEAYIGAKFKADKQLQILARFYPEKYDDLVVFTISMARRRHVLRAFETARFAVSNQERVSLTHEWRSGTRKDTRLNRSCYHGCGPALICLPFYGVYKLASLGYGSVRNCFTPKHVITINNAPNAPFPQEVLADVERGSGLAFTDQTLGVFVYGQPSVSKRSHTQTPHPATLRLGGNGSCVLKLKDNTQLDFCESILGHMEGFAPKSFVYFYGPFLVGWHANQNSPGGAVGMFRALLTPVKMTDGTFISAEDSAIRGQLLHDSGKWFNTPWAQPIIVENEERIQWCENHVKSALYTPAVKKIITTGVRPTLNKCAVIPKTNELLLKDKERIIISGGEEFVAWYGQEASVLNKRFKDAFSLEKWWQNTMQLEGAGVSFVWGSGTTPEQRGQWYDMAIDSPPKWAAITVCGDDFACIMNIGGIVFGLESDASNWDHSQVLMELDGVKKGLLNIQYRYYREFGASEDLIDALIKGGSSGMNWTSERKGEVLSAKLGYSRRCSGFVDTTDGNTLVMAHMMANICLQIIHKFSGEVEDLCFPAIEDHTVFLGAMYGVKLKVKVHENPRHMTFLKGFYVDAVVGGKRGTIWYPSPEILMKLGTSEANPDNSVAYRKLQSRNPLIKGLARKMRVYDILNSWSTFNGMPLLGALQQMVGQPLRGVTYEESRARIQDMDKWDKPEITSKDISQQDFGPMLEVLGIQEDLESFERLCRNVRWEPGMYVTHPLVSKLAARYA